MRNRLAIIFSLILLNFGLVFIFYYITQGNHRNGFQRTLRDRQLKKMIVYELPSPNLYLIHSDKEGFWLKDTKVANTLRFIGANLDTTRLIKLPIPIKANSIIETLKVGLKGDTVYVVNRNDKKLRLISARSNLDNEYSIPFAGFDASILLSKQSIVGRETWRSDSSTSKKLIKLNYNTSRITAEHELKKQVDGLICTDGRLRYDPQSEKLFYMFFYRGSYLCLDTNLALIYEAKTIDTIKFADLKGAGFVNRNLTIYNGNVYVLSAKKSDNESYWNFRRSQVIDVYNESTGTYQYSFYIPKYKEKKLREFWIRKNLLYANYGDSIIMYEWLPA